MTIRTARRRFAGIVLALQVLVAFGAAHGLVLCVGPAGHVAVEDYEAALRCHASAAALEANPVVGASVLGVTSECADTPLLQAAPERSASPLRISTASVAASSVVEPPRRDVLPGRSVWEHRSLQTSAHILRSVVLLI